VAQVEVFEPDRPPTRNELLEGARRADALVTLLSDRVDGELLDACPRVRVVANYAVGFDNIDVPAATERGVWVANTPDVLTAATADLTMGLLLAVARRLREGERMVREGRFDGWAPNMLLGLELSGATLGIVGFGRIGQAVGERARAFGMRVLYTSRSERAPSGAARRVPLPELLREADVVSVHCPLGPDTHHLLDAEALGAMKSGALLINTARGPIVDEAALATALERGHLGGAGLDVYENEPEVHPALLERDDVVLVPHLGSATVSTRRRMAELALGSALAVLRGDPPTHPVNRPTTLRS
jgi:glyoxylate reductase